MASALYQCVFKRSQHQTEACSLAHCSHEGVVSLYSTSEPTRVYNSLAILVLAVPTNCLPADLARIGDFDASAIIGWRHLTHANSGQQSVIVEFAHSDYALQLCSSANGKIFNDLNCTEICYTLPLEYSIGLECCNVNESQFSSLLTPSPDQQVPSCPRCLERLDVSISGLPPPNCSHRFGSSFSPHSCQCVSSWSNMNCMLCSTIQTSSTDDYQCESCSTPSNLWICLLCCRIGCNRFHKSHAIEHFHVTGHRYALELTSAISLWDYKGDGYIHRILPGDSKYDGSSSPRRQTVFKKPAGDSDDSLTDVKLESLIMYYNQMLLSQLQAQIDHFNLDMEAETIKQMASIKQNQDRLSSEHQILQQLAGQEASLRKTASLQQRKLAKARGRNLKMDSDIAQIKRSNATILKNITQTNIELRALQEYHEELQRKRIIELQDKVDKAMNKLS